LSFAWAFGKAFSGRVRATPPGRARGSEPGKLGPHATYQFQSRMLNADQKEKGTVIWPVSERDRTPRVHHFVFLAIILVYFFQKMSYFWLFLVGIWPSSLYISFRE
jgi:hypothetical protein